LDTKTGEEIISLLKKISEKQLVIVVSHDRELANAYGDQIIELKDGQIHQIQSLNKQEHVGITQNDNLNLYKSSQSVIIGIKLALQSGKRKIIQSFFSIVYIALTISILFITISTLFFNFENLFIDILENNQINKISLEKQLETYNYDASLKMNDKDIDYLHELFPNLKINPTKPFQVDYSGDLFNEIVQTNDNTHFSYTFGISKINLDIMLSYEYDLVVGTYPQNPNEILITKYIYDIINNYEWKINDELYLIDSYHDVIGLNLYDDYYYGNMTITGVIDTGNYENEISEAVKHYQSNSLYEVAYTILRFGGHNNIYVNTAYFDQITTIPVTGQYTYMDFYLNQENISVERLQSINYISDNHYLFSDYENIGSNQGIISINLLQDVIDYNVLNDHIYASLLAYVKNEAYISKDAVYDAINVFYPDIDIPHYDEWTDDTYYNLYVNLTYISIYELTGNKSEKDLNKLKYNNPFGATGLELTTEVLSSYIGNLSLELDLSVFYDNQEYINQEDFSIIGISMDSRSTLTVSDLSFNKIIIEHHIGKYDYVHMRIESSNPLIIQNIVSTLLNQNSDIKYVDVGYYYSIIYYTKTNADNLKPILIGLSSSFLIILVIYVWLITLLNFQMQKKNIGILYSLGVNKRIFIVSFVSEMIIINFIATLIAIPVVFEIIKNMNFAYSQTVDNSYNILHFDVLIFIKSVIVLFLLTALINTITILLKIRVNPNKLLKSK